MTSLARPPKRLDPTALWDRFEAKAVALGATVIRAEDASAITAALEGNPPTEVACRAELAVAETGSVLVSLPNAERGAALLSDRLRLIVRAEDIVPTLDEALAKLGTLIASGTSRYATFISGPSRTADIERTLTIGVHGPGAVAIVIVGPLP